MTQSMLVVHYPAPGSVSSPFTSPSPNQMNTKTLRTYYLLQLNHSNASFLWQIEAHVLWKKVSDINLPFFIHIVSKKSLNDTYILLFTLNCIHIISNATQYIAGVYGWGSFNDVIYSILTLYLMTSKLFALIIESENQRKCSRTRFSIHQHIQTWSDDQKAIAVNAMEDSNSPTTTPRISNSPKVMAEFMQKTEDQNEIILLISKFLILLCCVIASSQCVLLIFISFRDIVLILYSIDTFINMICLYLSFQFSVKYYNEYLCGRCCTRCCFPIIKTITLQYSKYERNIKKKYTINDDDVNQCFVCCKWCCFGCFCDENINFESTKSIYSLARFEVDLMVMTNIGKTEQNKDIKTNQMPQ